MPKFKIGDRVERIAESPLTGAVVVAIEKDMEKAGTEVHYVLELEEGGSSTMPESMLRRAGEPPPDEAA